MCTDPCVVCSEGDECGPVQHTDYCDKPFHIDGCNVQLGIKAMCWEDLAIGPCHRCKAEKKRRKAEVKATAIVAGDGDVPAVTE